jgi:transporter family-2 protein
MAATVVNFVVGFSGLLAVAVGAWATGTLTFSGWPTQWWLYLGGPIGVLFIALAAWAVRGLGVFTGSVLVDLATLGPTVLGALQWVGLVLIAIAVVLAAVPDRGRWSGRMAR